MLIIRQYFHSYYELRRRFRSWKRQLFLFPNQTYEDLEKKGFMLKFFRQLIIWNLVGIYAFRFYFREEMIQLKEKGIESPGLMELWNEKKIINEERKDNSNTAKYFQQPNMFSIIFNRLTPTRTPIDLTKIKYPQDDI